MEKINFDECHTKWGKKPEWSLSLKHLRGEIIAVNDDGTYDVKYHHPLDCHSCFSMDRTATAELEVTDFWMTDAEKERIISGARKKLKVGSPVYVNEYRSLFYIYTWKKVYDWSRAHLGELKVSYKFKSGDPHLGYKEKFKIDI